MSKWILYETTKPASLESVREIRLVLQRLLSLRRVDKALSDKISLAFAEAATNCVMHNPTATSLNVSLLQDSDCVYVVLLKDGQPWDMTAQTYQGIDSLFEGDESGRGLELINALTDRVDYQPYYQEHYHRLMLSWQIPEKCDKPRVLIIEDDRIAQQLYASYLSDRYQVERVSDGIQALEKLETQEYELLLSDIAMPGMDGMCFREQLLKRDKGLLIPFIFLTGTENGQVIEQANGLGVDDYLLKPIHKSHLLYAVERAINRSFQLKKALGNMIHERICRALLPQIPNDMPYWQCQQQHSYSGCGGGDIVHYYPFIDEDGGEAGLIMLADVEGHDETAKFFSHAFAGYFRGMIHGYLDGGGAAVTDTALSLENLMQQISNGIYTDQLLSQSTITMLLLSIHQGGRVRVVCAGHPPPLLLGVDEMRPLAVGGLLPGLVSDISYKMIEVKMAPSERLALYTDGLLESKTVEQQCVENDMLQRLHVSMAQPLDRAVRFLVDHFKQVADPTVQDDATLILLQAKW